MFWRMLRRSLTRGLRQKALVVLTIAVGASLSTAVLNISLDVGDKLNRELKNYGANIILEPRAAALERQWGSALVAGVGEASSIREADLPRIKMIFWRNNIVDFAPYLETTARLAGGREVTLTGTWFAHDLALPTGETVTTGVRSLKPWWRVAGAWPAESGREALLGQGLARELGLAPGDTLQLAAGPAGRPLNVTVAGVLNSGGEEDEAILAPLPLVQGVLDRSGQVGRVEVSALTTPENDLARKAAADPEALTREEFETWYCTAYVSAITYQLEEALPGVRARAVRQVAEAEGVILRKVQLLMFILAAAALAGAALGISNLLTAKVRERAAEVGLMKALGASGPAVAAVFLGEALLEGLLGGLAGYGLGLGLAWWIGRAAFGMPFALQAWVLPLVLGLATLVTLGGSLSSLLIILRLRPAEVLRGSR